jgi:hypothetical protein
MGPPTAGLSVYTLFGYQDPIGPNVEDGQEPQAAIPNDSIVRKLAPPILGRHSV